MTPLRLPDDRVEELPSHLVCHQARPVLRKRRVVERWIEQIHPQEPAEQQVVAELLAEGALRPNRIERHQKRCLEQMLRRDRWSAYLGVHLLEQR